ncbi:membrane-associated tyrosine- and threonine-specific cdc2-inhibitory kinase isoform 8 [Mus musculus]|uniref:membrane-associated tyrosine- and threonine-specific cdc2-inhibitory kinase isoform 8 n=1 Tax=Mus musculus TaxID=10090 RepID=UPI0003D76203|nr:membrane-associated tyrosine- and threonine-specific cdc2-inhibitory kinase isoform 8 [Mus musculus]
MTRAGPSPSFSRTSRGSAAWVMAHMEKSSRCALRKMGDSMLLSATCRHSAAPKTELVNWLSLGLTILEVACNMELPHGGEGWQQLRQGYLPPEFTAGLSSELRSVLAMMLEPDPQLRATAEALLALPMLRQPRPWNVLWYMAAEALSRGWALWQALVTLLCWLWHGLVHPASWLQPPGPPATPPGSPPCSPLLDSTLSSSWDNDSIGPSLSPETVLSRITRRTSTPRGRYIPRDALDLTDVDSEPPRGPCPTFEPRNLLSLFEDSLDPA